MNLLPMEAGAYQEGADRNAAVRFADGDGSIVHLSNGDRDDPDVSGIGDD